ncbi:MULTISPECIES: ABC transporter ATP-binding protein [unclassified Neptuniibacter]|jgi:cobalt/nickel transport system ATP-binding protein|uniref:energy-coupling factor ABC transporter ATP-binding protein n=1 Tax=unclassified Neptuniibacter TaxID=2630693 RepID=UPI0025E892E4|nr:MULTISPECIES: ABC transporter ATP-binding protein [unclassified Neptuniibacter]|tara:strand:- start:6310 stop:7050 length:741 start_codon:yes stop_codon:yes gene_type:complete
MMMQSLIKVSGLSYRYPRRGLVLDKVDFHLDVGERVALTGANGAGKTTLLHLLVGLKKAKSGEIFAFGSIRKEEKSFVEVRAQAGFLFQDPDDQLFCPTVIEDVAFGPLNLGKSRAEALQIASETLASLGMAGFEERITHQLSGGEKRMITLAAVLAMEPEVLLLDEPSNALDAKARQHLIDTLKTLPQAMIIISHDADFLAQLATREVRLEEAKLVAVSNKIKEVNESESTDISAEAFKTETVHA